MRLKISAVFGWGVTIYAILYLAWNLMAANGFTNFLESRIVLVVLLFVVSMIAVRSLRLHSWADVLPYSFVWMLIAIALDALGTVPLAGWGMFFDWHTWIGYALVLALPLLFPVLLRLSSGRSHE